MSLTPAICAHQGLPWRTPHWQCGNSDYPTASSVGELSHSPPGGSHNSCQLGSVLGLRAVHHSRASYYSLSDVALLRPFPLAAPKLTASGDFPFLCFQFCAGDKPSSLHTTVALVPQSRHRPAPPGIPKRQTLAMTGLCPSICSPRTPCCLSHRGPDDPSPPGEALITSHI